MSQLVLQRLFIGFRMKSYKALHELTPAFPVFTSLLGSPPAIQKSFLFLQNLFWFEGVVLALPVSAELSALFFPG